MEDVIGTRDNTSSTKDNIKYKVNDFDKSKKRYLKSAFNKLLLQTFICLVLVAMLYLYKYFRLDSYTYNMNKYKWIINSTITYNDMYNNTAEYINNKFGFNIPLKALQEENQNETIVSDINDETIETVESAEEAIEVSNSYDNMRIMADEIIAKYNLVRPTEGKITCPFGNRDSSNKNISSFHLGLDIANKVGTDIFCALDGMVDDVGYNSTYGNYIKVITDDILIVYAHCSKVLISKGDNVSAGQKIALMGQTGNATGPHLHFEVRKNGLVINPEYIIDFK